MVVPQVHVPLTVDNVVEQSITAAAGDDRGALLFAHGERYTPNSARASWLLLNLADADAPDMWRCSWSSAPVSFMDQVVCWAPCNHDAPALISAWLPLLAGLPALAIS